MLAKYFNKSRLQKYFNWLILPIWVFGGIMVGFAMVAALVNLLVGAGVSFKNFDKNVFQLVAQAVSYIMALLVVIGVPYVFFKDKITLALLGLKNKIKWTFPLAALAGFGVYYMISIFFMFVAVLIYPDFDIGAKQDVGFESLSNTMDYVVAFVALVIAAPLAEEVIFRGFLFGTLKKTYRFWIAAILTSLMFGFAHGAWNVGIDTFALSLVLCYLRYNYDSLYPAIFLHMIKNGFAYVMLFIVKPF